MTKTFVAISAVLLGATGALAQPPLVVTGDQAPTAIVSFADLNLGSRAGQDRLTHRIRAAASDLCLESNKAEIEFEMARRGCYRKAVSSGIDQMNEAIAGRASNSAVATTTLIITAR
jgi:UrcA family protein